MRGRLVTQTEEAYHKYMGIAGRIWMEEPQLLAKCRSEEAKLAVQHAIYAVRGGFQAIYQYLEPFVAMYHGGFFISADLGPKDQAALQVLIDDLRLIIDDFLLVCRDLGISL